MVNIAALMNALPVSTLEPNAVARIRGLIDAPKAERWRDSIALFEPPAGQHVPYIEPLLFMEVLARRGGRSRGESSVLAQSAVERLKATIDRRHIVLFFDFFDPASPECVPLPDFLEWLRSDSSLVGFRDSVDVPAHFIDLFEQVGEVASEIKFFHGPDNRGHPWSLRDLPALPPPRAMMEFVPHPPWEEYGEWGDWKTTDNPFIRWRENMRETAKSLESALGEPVYRFADLTNDQDDDDVHRFLVLHWCCSYRPTSPYVQHLLRVSGARDVDELKTALIDPASYFHPFKMDDSFVGLETNAFHVEYEPAGEGMPAMVVTSYAQALELSQTLLPAIFGDRAIAMAFMET